MPFELKWEHFSLEERESYRFQLVFKEYEKYKNTCEYYEECILEQDKNITKLKKENEELKKELLNRKEDMMEKISKCLDDIAEEGS